MSAFAEAGRVLGSVVSAEEASAASLIPLQPVAYSTEVADIAGLSDADRSFLSATGWTPKSPRPAFLAGADGALGKVLAGFDAGDADPFASFSFGRWAASLPSGTYRLDPTGVDAGQVPNLVRAWLSGVYRDVRFRSAPDGENAEETATNKRARLAVPDGFLTERLQSEAKAIAFGRDLINAPANALGTRELADAAMDLAAVYGAQGAVVEGVELETGFPLIHAVGRASARPPLLVDLSWTGTHGADGPRVTLVGKGIVFDTGGLNIKPGGAMTLMKKDMGGAAATLCCAAQIMAADLPVRLRVLLPIAENSIDGSAFRPGDVLTARSGTTVEIGNTDAEGRLVLADALTLADADEPDYLFTFATLTGAARVAFGADLPPFATTDPDFGRLLQRNSLAVADPLWEQPFWQPYDKMLASRVADVSHISDSPFAGSITAALFLKRFVKKAHRFTHLDIYGWVPAAKPGRPMGGQPQGASAVFSTLEHVLSEERA